MPTRRVEADKSPVEMAGQSGLEGINENRISHPERAEAWEMRLVNAGRESSSG